MEPEEAMHGPSSAALRWELGQMAMASDSAPQHWTQTDSLAACVVAAVHAGSVLCCKIDGRNFSAFAPADGSSCAEQGQQGRDAGRHVRQGRPAVSDTPGQCRAEVTAALHAGSGLRHQPGRLLPV